MAKLVLRPESYRLSHCVATGLRSSSRLHPEGVVSGLPRARPRPPPPASASGRRLTAGARCRVSITHGQIEGDGRWWASASVRQDAGAIDGRPDGTQRRDGLAKGDEQPDEIAQIDRVAKPRRDAWHRRLEAVVVRRWLVHRQLSTEHARAGVGYRPIRQPGGSPRSRWLPPGGGVLSANISKVIRSCGRSSSPPAAWSSCKERRAAAVADGRPRGSRRRVG